MKANGLIIKCMDKAYSNGQMVESIMDNSRTIKGTAMDILSGQTEENTKDNGSKGNSMA